MGITALFSNTLGAPLHHRRMSWGSIRNDGVVFLRVWDEERLLETRRGRTFARLAFHDWYEGNPDNWGYRERNQHIDALEERSKSGDTEIGYVVMCTPRYLENGNREIDSYVAETVRRIIGLQRRRTGMWAELGPAIDVAFVSPVCADQH